MRNAGVKLSFIIEGVADRAAKKRRTNRAAALGAAPSPPPVDPPRGPAVRTAITGAQAAAVRRLDEHQKSCVECRNFIDKLFEGPRGKRCGTGEILLRDASWRDHTTT